MTLRVQTLIKVVIIHVLTCRVNQAKIVIQTLTILTRVTILQLSLRRNTLPSAGSKRQRTAIHNKCMEVWTVDPSIKLGNVNPVYMSKEIDGILGPHFECRDGGLLITCLWWQSIHSYCEILESMKWGLRNLILSRQGFGKLSLISHWISLTSLFSLVSRIIKSYMFSV